MYLDLSFWTELTQIVVLSVVVSEDQRMSSAAARGKDS